MRERGSQQLYQAQSGTPGEGSVATLCFCHPNPAMPFALSESCSGRAGGLRGGLCHPYDVPGWEQDPSTWGLSGCHQVPQCPGSGGPEAVAGSSAPSCRSQGRDPPRAAAAECLKAARAEETRRDGGCWLARQLAGPLWEAEQPRDTKDNSCLFLLVHPQTAQRD